MSNQSKGNSELKHDKCVRCNKSYESLLALHDCISFLGYCNHIFCKKCFKKENLDLHKNIINRPKCPCCRKEYYEFIESIDQALYIGEAAYLNYKAKQHSLQIDADPDVMHNLHNDAIEKLNEALLLTPANSLFNIIIARCMLYACLKDLDYLKIMEQAVRSADRLVLKPRMYSDSNSNTSKQYSLRQRVQKCCLDLIDKAFDSTGTSLIHSLRVPEDHPHEERGELFNDTIDWYHNLLSGLFYACGNIPASVKHAQLAVDTCLCSSDHPNLVKYKQDLQRSKIAFDKETPLRFTLNEEVEFLVEEEGTSAWRAAKVVELYYRERDFPLVFTSPYRLKLHGQSVVGAPVYAWVKADLDRYVRKPGVRSIEDTRYQARLEAKVGELAQVYCLKEFIEGINHTLAQDREFVNMLDKVWHITLSIYALSLYRMLEMYRHPLVRTDSGYHIPTAEEVIAGIRAFFDPADRTLAASSAASDARISEPRRAKAAVIAMLQTTVNPTSSASNIASVYDIECVEAMYMRVFCSYSVVCIDGSTAVDIYALVENGFSVPLPSHCVSPEVSNALSTVAGSGRIESMIFDPLYVPARMFLTLWKNFVKFLDLTGTGPARECPLVYFFVKYCIDQGAGVPKPALALYDGMNMQLSREFIRCGNPTCEFNKLDQSTGQVKFKKCSRCQAVIYCSKECQLADYPLHKKMCRKHSG